MEFKKINENTFQCLLTKEDMEDFDITMEDFLRDHDKTMEFMHQIIERSEEEIDFDVSGGGVMSMQISPLPNEGLSLVFTNKQPMSGMDILSHLRDMLKAHVEGLTDEDINEAAEAFELAADEVEEEEDDDEVHSFDFKDLADILNNVGKETKKEKKKRIQRLYYFDSFSSLESFCKTWSGKPVKSQILKLKSETGYYLIIEKGKLGINDYAVLLDMLSEYAQFITYDDVKILSLREHAETVIAKDAVAVLNKL